MNDTQVSYLVVGQGNHDDVVMTEVKRLAEQLNDEATWNLRRLVGSLKAHHSARQEEPKARTFGLVHDAMTYTSITLLRAPAKRESIVWAVNRALRAPCGDESVYEDVKRCLDLCGMDVIPRRDPGEEE